MEETNTTETKPTVRQLYLRYAPAVLPLIVTDGEGNEQIGSAFHVGDGSFVTAWHVASGQNECRVEVDALHRPLPPLERVPDKSFVRYQSYAVTPRPGNKLNNDVAVFSVPELSDLPFIPLGDHLDDWISDKDFILNEVLILGYPPIPLSSRPILIAASGQLNAVVDLINVDHVHFVVSVTARGGFSGGVAIGEWGIALGVITSSLVKNGAPEELGYLTILSVEPIPLCLADNLLLPTYLAELWDGHFTEQKWYFGKPALSWAQAFLTTDYDGHRTILSFACPSNKCVEECHRKLSSTLEPTSYECEIKPVDVHHIIFAGDPALAGAAMRKARDVIEQTMSEHDFLAVERPVVIHRSLESPFGESDADGSVAFAFARTKNVPGISERHPLDGSVQEVIAAIANRKLEE